MTTDGHGTAADTREREATHRFGFEAWELGEGSLELGAGVRLLLWDYPRGSLAYDLAFGIVVLVLLVVPGGFWGDPLWR